MSCAIITQHACPSNSEEIGIRDWGLVENAIGPRFDDRRNYDAQSASELIQIPITEPANPQSPIPSH